MGTQVVVSSIRTFEVAHSGFHLRAWVPILGSVAAESERAVGYMGALVRMLCIRSCSAVL